MREDGYDHLSSRYRAMVFDGPDSMIAAREQVTAAMNRTFGTTKYTTNESWLVGGQEGNGEVDTEGPLSSPAWRQRIDKARREIDEHRREWRVRTQAEALTRQEIETDIQEIRRWANSLKERQ